MASVTWSTMLLGEGDAERLLEVLAAVEELRGAARGAAPVGGRRRVHGERLGVEDDAVVFLGAAQADEAVAHVLRHDRDGTVEGVPPAAAAGGGEAEQVALAHHRAV